MAENTTSLSANELAFNSDPLSPSPAMRSGRLPRLASLERIIFSLVGLVASLAVVAHRSDSPLPARTGFRLFDK